ncbi:MAG: phage terminase large subunit [Clostridia bacterium]|nr:phage terminase large subunit [Clostridia bacterium]
MATELHIGGIPSAPQQRFFDSRARFTAYGGARGGGKSWALRRKLILLCLRYRGIRCLLVRRTYPELRSNHVEPLLHEYGALLRWHESEKRLEVRGGSSIQLGYCANDRDVLRYQGQEYDIIAIDEATQLSEYQFSIFKACLRGTSPYPRRMYLTCNPGGVGHSWVKRLFVDRDFRENERPDDYCFIPARVFDNSALLGSDPDYVDSLRSLPPRLRDAWLVGRWDVFEGQFFPEFDPTVHTVDSADLPAGMRHFAAMDYGLDMLALLYCGIDADANIWVERELCRPELTLGDASEVAAEFCRGCEYIVASPDLWNRRQDSGLSGVEILSRVPGIPPLRPADDRRIPGWRVVHDYLAAAKTRGSNNVPRPALYISKLCPTLIGNLSALLCDPNRPEDAAAEPHILTHAPEALRYALMSRASPPEPQNSGLFTFRRKPSIYEF